MYITIEVLYILLAVMALTLLWQIVALVVQGVRWLKKGWANRTTEKARPAVTPSMNGEAAKKPPMEKARTTLSESLRDAFGMGPW